LPPLVPSGGKETSFAAQDSQEMLAVPQQFRFRLLGFYKFDLRRLRLNKQVLKRFSPHGPFGWSTLIPLETHEVVQVGEAITIFVEPPLFDVFIADDMVSCGQLHLGLE
jgi:hypothetical protein